MWIEWLSWQAHTGPAPDGAFFQRLYTLEEMPLFSPAGAVLPLRTLPDQGAAAARAAGHADALGTAGEVPGALDLWVFPPGPDSLGGAEPGAPWATRFASSGRLYDDDGLTVAYSANAAGEFLWTEVACEWQRTTLLQEVVSSGLQETEDSLERARALGADTGLRDRLVCTVRVPEGRAFAAFPLARTYSFRVLAAHAPESVRVGQNADDFEQFAGFYPERGPNGGAADAAWGDGARWPANANAWSWDAAQACAWVHVGLPAATSNPTRVTLTWPRGARADDPVLTSAVARKVSRAQAAKREMARISWSAFPADVPRLLGAANVAARAEEVLERHNVAGGATAASSAEVRALLEGLHGELEAAVAEVNALEQRLRDDGVLPPREAAIGADGEAEAGAGAPASAEAYAAQSAVATMRALLVNGVS